MHEVSAAEVPAPAGTFARLRLATGSAAGRSSIYLYLLPAVAVYAVFFLRPLVELVRLSLFSWDGVSPKTFVGTANYRELAGDAEFWQALKHNAIWMAAGVVIPTIIGLVVAVVLVRGSIHGRGLFRALLFLPQVLSSVVVAIVWGWLYNPSSGALNKGLHAVGLSGQDWLGSPNLVLGALFAVWAWATYGFGMVVLGAAIQTIDESYFDAAKVDRAGKLQQLRFVLLPAIRRPLTVVVLINAITAFQVFDLVFIMTSGGPFGSSNVLELYMYNNAFQYNRVGYGASVAVTLGVVILAFSLLFLHVARLTHEET
jgi:ABC-type sugar transport system permease subunit